MFFAEELCEYNSSMEKQFFNEIIEILEEENPDAQLADGFDEALIGVSRNHFHHENTVAVYDAEQIIDILVVRDGMTISDAHEFFEFNVQGSYVGKNTPLFIWTS